MALRFNPYKSAMFGLKSLSEFDKVGIAESLGIQFVPDRSLRDT